MTITITLKNLLYCFTDLEIYDFIEKVSGKIYSDGTILA